LELPCKPLANDWVETRQWHVVSRNFVERSAGGTRLALAEELYLTA
jgi:hypothetical protein